MTVHEHGIISSCFISAKLHSSFQSKWLHVLKVRRAPYLLQSFSKGRISMLIGNIRKWIEEKSFIFHGLKVVCILKIVNTCGTGKVLLSSVLALRIHMQMSKKNKNRSLVVLVDFPKTEKLHWVSFLIELYIIGKNIVIFYICLWWILVARSPRSRLQSRHWKQRWSHPDLIVPGFLIRKRSSTRNGWNSSGPGPGIPNAWK